jgi:hypothetical protein
MRPRTCLTARVVLRHSVTALSSLAGAPGRKLAPIYAASSHARVAERETDDAGVLCSIAPSSSPRSTAARHRGWHSHMKTLPSRRVRKPVRYVALLADLLATWERRVLLRQCNGMAGIRRPSRASRRRIAIRQGRCGLVAGSWQRNHHRRPVR